MFKAALCTIAEGCDATTAAYTTAAGYKKINTNNKVVSRLQVMPALFFYYFCAWLVAKLLRRQF